MGLGMWLEIGMRQGIRLAMGMSKRLALDIGLWLWMDMEMKIGISKGYQTDFFFLTVNFVYSALSRTNSHTRQTLNSSPLLGGISKK